MSKNPPQAKKEIPAMHPEQPAESTRVAGESRKSIRSPAPPEDETPPYGTQSCHRARENSTPLRRKGKQPVRTLSYSPRCVDRKPAAPVNRLPVRIPAPSALPCAPKLSSARAARCHSRRNPSVRTNPAPGPSRNSPSPLASREEFPTVPASPLPTDKPAPRWPGPAAALSAKTRTGTASRCETPPGDTRRGSETAAAHSAESFRGAANMENRRDFPAPPQPSPLFSSRPRRATKTKAASAFHSATSPSRAPAARRKYVREGPDAAPHQRA